MEEWLILQSTYVIYLALFAALIGGAIGLPIPEDLPLLCAGIVIHSGKTNLWVTLIVCYLGILAGDLIVFHIGRLFGPAIFKKKFFRKRVSPKRLVKIKRSLEKKSFIMIFVARHLFYLRTVTFLSCGALGMKRKRFFLNDAIAALISTPLMTYIGFKASEHLDTIRAYEKQVFLILGVIICFYLFFKFFPKKQVQ